MADHPKFAQHDKLITEIANLRCFTGSGKTDLLGLIMVNSTDFIKVTKSGPYPKGATDEWHTVALKVLRDDDPRRPKWVDDCSTAEIDEIGKKFSEAEKLHNELMLLAETIYKENQKAATLAAAPAAATSSWAPWKKAAAPAAPADIGSDPVELNCKCTRANPPRGSARRRKTRRRRTGRKV